MIHRLEIGCKVNLFLAITGVRADGYHELETLFYPCPAPQDTLELEMAGGAGGQGLILTCSDKALETPGNLAIRAYEAFADRTGCRPGLRAHLTKRIPSGAGLGGGSADAAAMLRWLNDQARAGGQDLPEADLTALAAGLGADVPFFLVNSPAWATGIGDALKPAPCSLSGLSLLVAVPPERVETAWAYKAWDQAQARGEGALSTAPQSQAPLTSLCPASMGPFCVSGAFIANSFEAVVFRAYPAVRLLKERLLAQGAAAAGMSGSGSAVFGIFRDASRARDAATALAVSGTAVFSALL
jgi:4-diphosphocytidyl-2-C-methyl-D-erythritol kinase